MRLPHNAYYAFMLNKQMSATTATSPRRKIIEFLKRDLKALKRLMPEHERAEVPALLEELDGMARGTEVNFATGPASKIEQEVGT